jgi:hypothetical protein
VPKAFWNGIWIGLFCVVVTALGFEALTASQDIPKQQNTYRAESAKRGADLSAATLNESYSAEQTNKRKEKQTQATEHTLEFFNIKFSDAIIALFTIVLAVKTAGLFKETAGLRSAADKQSRDMEASIKAATDAVKNGITANQIAIANSQQQLRAYVAATNVNVVFHRDPDRISPDNRFRIDGPVNTYRLSAILRNGGQTPAINVVTNISCQRLQRTVLPTFYFPDSTNFGHGVIGPASEVHTRDIPVAAHAFDPINDTEWFLWGWVEYDDIFGGQRHRTEFAFEITRTRLQNSTETWVSFHPLDRFNAVDGACLRLAANHNS